MDTLWKVRDVARFLNYTEGWVRLAAKEGKIPALRLGAGWRFSPEAIKGWAVGESAEPRVKEEVEVSSF